LLFVKARRGRDGSGQDDLGNDRHRYERDRHSSVAAQEAITSPSITPDIAEPLDTEEFERLSRIADESQLQVRSTFARL
jgi:hypothetical protein